MEKDLVGFGSILSIRGNNFLVKYSVPVIMGLSFMLLFYQVLVMFARMRCSLDEVSYYPRN